MVQHKVQLSTATNFSTNSLEDSDVDITGEFVRNTDSRAPLEMHVLGWAGGEEGPRDAMLNRPPQSGADLAGP